MDLTQGKLDAAMVDPMTGGRRYISEAIQERKDQIYDDMSVGEKFSDLVTRGEKYGGPNRERFDDPPELFGQRIPSYESRRRENDPRYQELFDMRDEYQSEVDKHQGIGGGLMSLLRGAGDMVLGEDIMENLPMLLRAMEGTNKDTLTMQETRDMSGPLDETSLSVQLSNTPGLSSILGPEVGMLAAMAGGPMGKGKSAKEILEEIMELGRKMRSEQDIIDTRRVTENEADLPDFLKSFSQKQKERKGKEGFRDLVQEGRDEYMDSPEALEEAMRVQKDIMRKARRDGDLMAAGGRPGLYANIAAKRKRIAAGSGEKMRKAGSKGAPTKENFRQAETTAKKANGGGLSYAKGYYGKSYK